MALKKSVEQHEADIINNTNHKFEIAALELERKKFFDEISEVEFKRKMKRLNMWKRYELNDSWKNAHKLAGIRFFDDEFY